MKFFRHLILIVIFSLFINVPVKGFSNTIEIKEENYNNFAELNDKNIRLELEQKVISAILNQEKTVDVSEFNISINDAPTLLRIDDYSPYLKDVSIANNMTINSNGCIKEIKLEYKQSLEEFKQSMAQVDEIINQILLGLSNQETKFKQLVWLYDYFCLNFQYDYENYNNNTIPEQSYKSGGIFIDKIGVCQAYAYGFMYILDKIGIEAYIASSESINHSWNIVNLDGKYYNLDVTYGDVVPDRYGLVSHKYLLFSDGYDLDRNDRNLEEISCYDTSYDGLYASVDSPIIFVNGHSYYINGTKLYQQDLSDNSIEILKNFSQWQCYIDGMLYLYNNKSYSGLFVLNNELYYNTDKEIRKINLNSKEDILVFKLESENNFIYGIHYDNEQISYYVADNMSDMKIGKVVYMKKDPEIKLDINSFEYNGKSVTYNLETSELASKPIVSFEINKSGQWQEIDQIPVEAGDYKINISISENDRYFAATYSKEFKIMKAKNEITDLEIADWYISQAPNQPSAKSKFGEIIYSYSENENGPYSKEKPTEAGKYYLKAEVFATNNYEGASKIISFEIKAIMLGDVNGDGKISPLDYVGIKNHIMETAVIKNEVSLLAADYNGDGRITPLDYVGIKNYIMAQ